MTVKIGTVNAGELYFTADGPCRDADERVRKAMDTPDLHEGSIKPESTMYIVTAVVSFYFGTQHEKVTK